jgi:hypothetical protein
MMEEIKKEDSIVNKRVFVQILINVFIVKNKDIGKLIALN